MQFTASAALPRTAATAYTKSVSLKLHSAGRCKRMGKTMRVQAPKPITHAAMMQGRKGSRGAPAKKWSVTVRQAAVQAAVPFHIELEMLRVKLNPYNIGDLSSAVIPLLRARLEVLEKRAATITAHRKAKFGTVIVVKAAPVLTDEEIRRAEIAAEICAAGGFAPPRGPRKSTTPTTEVVKRPRRPRGAAKVKIGWLDIVETKTVAA